MTLKIDGGIAEWNWKLAETSTAERVVELAEEGMSAAKIAEEMGINRSTAWRALKKAGTLPPRDQGGAKRSGNRHGALGGAKDDG